MIGVTREGRRVGLYEHYYGCIGPGSMLEGRAESRGLCPRAEI